VSAKSDGKEEGGDVNRRGKVGGREKIWGREEVEKTNNFGQGGCVFVHPQNGFNGLILGLILNWCIGGCWFTPAKWMVGWTGGFSCPLRHLLYPL